MISFCNFRGHKWAEIALAKIESKAKIFVNNDQQSADMRMQFPGKKNDFMITTRKCSKKLANHNASRVFLLHQFKEFILKIGLEKNSALNAMVWA